MKNNSLFYSALLFMILGAICSIYFLLEFCIKESSKAGVYSFVSICLVLISFVVLKVSKNYY